MLWLKITQIVLSILLVTVILLQNRGGGLGEVFGGSGGVYLTKRGVEKKIFIATIVIVILFIVSMVYSLFL
jgi:preprotein translocase subunit SecG